MSRPPARPTAADSDPDRAERTAPEVDPGLAPAAASGTGSLSDLPVAGLTRRRVALAARRPDRRVDRRRCSRARSSEASDGVDPRRRDARVQRRARRPRSPPLQRELQHDPAARATSRSRRASTASAMPREIPFTLGPTTPRRSAADAPGSAAVRLGAVADRRSPLESWLDAPVRHARRARGRPDHRSGLTHRTSNRPSGRRRRPYPGVDAQPPSRRAPARWRLRAAEGGRAQRMITIPVEDLVFVVCALVGGGLLLITVVLDDILGGILDALHGFDIGGISLMPLLLGVRRDVRRRRPVRHPGPRRPRRSGGDHRCRSSGVAGVGIAYVPVQRPEAARGRRARSRSATSSGRAAYVSVAIPAGRFGSVLVQAEGQTHEFTRDRGRRHRGRHARSPSRASRAPPSSCATIRPVRRPARPNRPTPAPSQTAATERGGVRRC